MRCLVRVLGVLACVAAVSGCASVTTIDFADPVGAEITIKKKDFVFPVAVRLAQRTATIGPTTKGYDIELDIPDGNSVLKTHGKLYVYTVTLSDVDRLARNYFRVPSEKVAALKKGAAVTIEGFSADGGKLVYRAILGVTKAESRLPTPI